MKQLSHLKKIIFFIAIFSLQGRVRTEHVNENRVAPHMHTLATITLEDYVTFLNETAAIQAIECPFIVRAGEPGNYHYQVTSENAKAPLSFLSWKEVVAYTDWKNKTFQPDIVIPPCFAPVGVVLEEPSENLKMATGPKNFFEQEKRAASIDKTLKSNLLLFEWQEMGTTIHQAGGAEVIGVMGAEEIGEDLMGLALLLGWGTGERTKTPSPPFVDSLSSTRAGSPKHHSFIRKGRAEIRSEKIEASKSLLDEPIGEEKTPAMIYERHSIKYLEGESNRLTQPLRYQLRGVQHRSFKNQNTQEAQRKKEWGNVTVRLKILRYYEKLNSNVTLAYEQAAEARGTIQIKPVLIIIAGPNGSGKTQLTKVLQTKYPHWTKNLVEINPDVIAQEEFGGWNDPVAIQYAANRADEIREKCLKERCGLLFETVLSIPEKVDFIWRAKRAGFFIQLLYVATNNPEINMLRIAWRVAQGGHTVPKDKIQTRYERSLQLALKVALIVDCAYFIDNTKGITTESSFEPQPLFHMINGAISKTYLSEEKFPSWIRPIYSQAREYQNKNTFN